MFRLSYRPELDGLRALAAIAVLIYHAPGKYVHGGWVGVDVFFVLSGFLITTLLIQEREKTGRVALGAFWVRRFRRLLPALVLVLLAVIAGEFLLFGTAAYWPTAHAVRMILFYVGNWPLAWQDQAIPAPLIHTWSLAVEEQFYLFVPLVVAGLLTWRFGLRALPWLASLGVLAVWVWRAAIVNSGPDFWARVYYGTDTRLDGLLLGMVLSGLAVSGTLARVPARVRQACAVAGAGLLIAVLSGYWYPSVRNLALYGLALVSVAASFVLAELISDQNTLASRVLSLPWLTWLGRRSYGIYLWHMPVSCYVTRAEIPAPDWTLSLFVCAVSLGLAALSFRYVEEPIRRARKAERIEPPVLVPLAV